MHSAVDNERDTIQRMLDTMPTAKATGTASSVNRAKLYEDEVEVARQAFERRHDMISSWRDGTSDSAHAAAAVVGTGKSHDWFDFQKTATSTPAHITYQRASFADEAALRSPTAWSSKHSMMRPMPRPRHEPIALPGSTAECFYPKPGTPSYMDDCGRLDRRPLTWNPPNTTRSKMLSLQHERGERIAQRHKALIVSQQRELDAADKLEQSRVRSVAAYHKKGEACQRVTESRRFQTGLETILLEPSSFLGCREAPPHMTSHWNTIQGSHRDPPKREQTTMVVSYRKAFPEQYYRPVPLAGMGFR